MQLFMRTFLTWIAVLPVILVALPGGARANAAANSEPAREELTPFQQSLQQDVQLNSRESVVMIDGVEYKKLELKGDTFYVVFKGRNEEIPYLLCDRPQGFKSEHLIEGTAMITKRTSAFFRALKETCVVSNGRAVQQVELSAEIGVTLPETPKSLIKNKKVGVNPVDPTKLNFSGEF